MTALIIAAIIAVILIIILIKTAVVVPQRSEYIVERLGKYSKTLSAGFHILFPFVDRIAYQRSLKEEVLDIPAQACITSDNVAVVADGVLYLQVMDTRASAYGIDNYKVAAGQLAQTSLRSVIGQTELDKTFETRDEINTRVVAAIDEAAQNWGIKVLRYEIKDMKPPADVMQAMEAQMRAEREKRAEIARSEGERDARINQAEGLKKEAIAKSEGEKQRRINEAEGHASEITKIAEATASGVERVAQALSTEGGDRAAALRVAEQYVDQFGKLAQQSNTMIIPATASDAAGMIATAMSVLDKTKQG
jgi:regulator of protease activity HflC (stomatin/prohibitin superfamily)